jgi:hypothetical protein
MLSNIRQNYLSVQCVNGEMDLSLYFYTKKKLSKNSRNYLSVRAKGEVNLSCYF